MVDDIIVVKFWGSCLSTSGNILRAAKKASAEAAKSRKVAVVVSALLQKMALSLSPSWRPET